MDEECKVTSWGVSRPIVPSICKGMNNGVEYDNTEEAMAKFHALLDEWWEQKQLTEK